jgi:hypothetical protein
MRTAYKLSHIWRSATKVSLKSHTSEARYCGSLTDINWFGEALTNIPSIRALLRHRNADCIYTVIDLAKRYQNFPQFAHCKGSVILTVYKLSHICEALPKIPSIRTILKLGTADCLQTVTYLARRYQKFPQFAHCYGTVLPTAYRMSLIWWSAIKNSLNWHTDQARYSWMPTDCPWFGVALT